MKMTFRFVMEAIKGIPQYYQENKVLFLFTTGVVLVLALYHLLYAIKLCSQIANPIIKIVIFALELAGSFALLLSGVMFNVAGEVAELKPEVLNRRFFVEIIVVGVFYCLFYAYVIYATGKREEQERKRKEWSKWDWEDSAERAAEQAKKFLSGIAIILISVILMFTGTGFVARGPVLFGKTIGKWFFGMYAGWTTSALMLFVAALIEIPLILLFGNRTAAAMDDMEEAMDKGIDIAVDKGMTLFERIFDNKDANVKKPNKRTPGSRGSAGRQQRSEKRSVWKTILIAGVVVLALIFVFRIFARQRSSEAAGETPSVNAGVDLQSKSIEELTEIAEGGNIDAMKQLGYQYDFGIDVERDQEMALYWYVKAAENGDASAQRSAGFLYSHADGDLLNYDEAFRWSMAAAEQENAYACSDVGYLYRDGHGVEQNDDEAEKWFMKAYDLGLVSACNSLGYLYLYPKGSKQPDGAAAAVWFEKGVEGGSQICAYDLAQLYEDGNGVEQSYEKAAQLYLQAAEGDFGDAYAQYHLGILYENGWGVPADREEALRWYKTAADRGHKGALSEYNRLSGE